MKREVKAEELVDIENLIRNSLKEYSYHVSEECIEATAQSIWDAYEGIILNGYA